jgi:uncharacterized protein YybS (DUF2232 family)
MLLPLLVFYYLIRYGTNRGKKYILIGCVLACMAGLIFQIIEQLLFSLTLIPTGFLLAGSVKRGESPHIAGIKGTLGLIGTWILATSILSFGMDAHPYTLLVNSLAQGMDEALAYYKANSTVSSETLFLLQQTFEQMKIWIPKVLPGILICMTLLITWVTMVSGNRLLFKKTGIRPWAEYRYWVLPERLVWIVIVSAVFIMVPMEPGRTIGLNVLLISGLLYCFQGTSIMIFYFYKWSVPVFLRTIIYLILFFQSFGAVFLAIVGVADVWFDVRKINRNDQESDS